MLKFAFGNDRNIHTANVESRTGYARDKAYLFRYFARMVTFPTTTFSDTVANSV